MDAKTSAKNKTGTLTVGNNNWDMPIYPGTIGPDVVDISKLYGQSGMFTFDPGFTSTASCESKITYIDGDEGICSIADIRLSNWPSTATSWRRATCCFTANYRPRHRRPTSTTASTGTRWCTSR